jgi:DNA primase
MKTSGFDKQILDMLKQERTIYLIFDQDDGSFLAATNNVEAILDLASFVDHTYEVRRFGVCRIEAGELRKAGENEKETADDALTDAAAFMSSIFEKNRKV